MFHKVQRRFLVVTWFLLATMLLATSPTMAADSSAAPETTPPDNRARNVLVLHSYHAGLLWTDSITAGIKHELQPLAHHNRPLNLHIEYLDTKRNTSIEYLHHITDLLRLKLAGRTFDLILTSDNDALNLLLDRELPELSEVPVVFCGVNNFQPQWLDGHANITGVIESPSFKETVALALQLHPATREVIFISKSAGATYQAINQQTSTLFPELKHHYQVTLWYDIPAEELRERLAKLESGQVVFLCSVIDNRDGSVLSFTDSLHVVRANSHVPIYGFWDFFVGEGVVGGIVVSGFGQGQQAARIATRILAGTPLSALAVQASAANLPLFDYTEMQRFGISPRVLPANSRIINQPEAFYPIAKKDFWFLTSVGVALLVLSLLLLRSLQLRRTAEAAIREKEERLRLALDGSRDGFWDWHVTSGVNFLDERWGEMLGYRPEELEQTIEQWQRLVHADDLPATRRVLDRCMAGEFSHFANEFRMRCKDGQWKWILSRGMVVHRDARQRPVRLTGTHRDITEQKAAEAALKAALESSESARSKIDAILSSLTDGLIVSNQQQQVVMLNQVAQQLLDVRDRDAIGQPVVNIIDQPDFHQHLFAVLGGDKETSHLDMALSDSGRQFRVIQARFSPIYTSNGTRSGAVTLLEDVSREREITQLKNEFISTAAHELRTPLTAILGFADLLLEQQALPEAVRREYLQIISTKTEALSALVDELLDLSRIEAGRLISVERTMVPLRETLLRMVEQYVDSCPNHRFVTDFQHLDRPLFIDRNKMTQVLENLLSNAVKYSPKGGIIQLRSAVVDHGFELTITDQGIGMTASQLERIFDKFYRVDNTNTAVSGLGLGLSIVKNILDAHAATIDVESMAGSGTTVRVRLPLPDPAHD